MIDAPVRAFHWLFALSFVGAWLTAESEHWRAVHVTLGYAFGGLLLFRLMYGLIGPKQARLSSLWRRVSGLAGWCRGALSGKLDLPGLATLAAGGAMLLMLSVAAPLVLSGYASHIEWLGLEDAMEEVHEFFANALMAFVVAHLALMVVLSVQRRKNLAQTMFNGANRRCGPGSGQGQPRVAGHDRGAGCGGVCGLGRHASASGREPQQSHCEWVVAGR